MLPTPHTAVRSTPWHELIVCLLLCWTAPVLATAESALEGRVVDAAGQPVAQAPVTLSRTPAGAGMLAITVFSDAAGRFEFPASPVFAAGEDLAVSVAAPGYTGATPATISLPAAAGAVPPVTLVVQRTTDMAAQAPASAWLAGMPDNLAKAKLMVDCVNCHQFPTPEVRTFIDSLKGFSGAESAAQRRQAWLAKFDAMSAIFAEALAPGRPAEAANAPPPGRDAFFYHEDVEDIVELLSEHESAGIQAPQNYGHGAPLAVTPKTVIREYEVPRPNAIREAITAGTPQQLWVADFFGDKVVRIDAVSGLQQDIAVPSDRASGPHTLVHGADGSVWLSGVFNSFVSRLDPATQAWKVWHLETQPAVSAHDLTYDWRNELAMDAHGRIWFSDIANNALGSFDPATGAATSHPGPLKPGRGPGEMSMYGIAMTSDHRHVCYAQLGGDFGCFDTEALRYVSQVEFPPGAGPRRLAITDEDTIYIPLFGTGQLIEYDARTMQRISDYDLPDRASGPYAATWDPRRRVVWIATSNADVIYRFDPEGKRFGVIPLPRQKAYLRMVFVDPVSGSLATSYANLPGPADGPRMAVLIDPGD